MPEATVTFEDGRSMRFWVTHYSVEQGSNVEVLGRGIVGRTSQTIELSGELLGPALTNLGIATRHPATQPPHISNELAKEILAYKPPPPKTKYELMREGL